MENEKKCSISRKEYLDTLKKYIAENKSNAEIAEMFGVPKSTVCYWVRANGLTDLRNVKKIQTAISKRNLVEKYLKQIEDEHRVVTKGHNADRHLCKTCVWRTAQADFQKGIHCNFASCALRSRGQGKQSAADCDKYIKGKRVKEEGEKC